MDWNKCYIYINFDMNYSLVPSRINLKLAPFGQIFKLWKIFRIFDS